MRLVGPLTVVRDGRVLTDAEVGSRKARTLLALLAVDRPGTVPVDRVVEALWPDGPPLQPAGNVATLVSRLRAALGPGAVAGSRTGYRLGDALSDGVDLDEAARLVRVARDRAAAGEPALALTAARRALGLLGVGAVLTDQPYADWAEACRADAVRLLRQARLAAAAAALEVADAGTAVSVATAAVDADPLDEAGSRLLMRAHLSAGEPARGLAEYARLRRVLAAELGTEPAAETRAIHVALLREEPAPAPSAPAASGVAAGGLVGRETEVARLAALWSAAAVGRAGLVLVTGEAGIGKTRLAAEVATLAAGTGGLVLRARCYRTERSLFLQPLADAVRPAVTGLPPAVLAELAGPDAAALAAVVSDVDGVLGSADPGRGRRRRRSGRAAAARLRRRGRVPAPAGGPVAGAARCWTTCTRPASPRSTSCTTSPGTTAGCRCSSSRPCASMRARTRSSGSPTSPSGCRSSRCPGPRSAGSRPRPTSRSWPTGSTGSPGDTPCSRWRPCGRCGPGSAGCRARCATPSLTRVRRLGPEVEEALRAASVLGPPFDPATIAGVLGIPAPEAARRCERALRAALLAVAGGAYEFANDLVQEVLSATTPEPTRMQYHRQAADLLADRPEAAAAHAAAAGQPTRAARAWLRAGEEALRRWAASDAERFLDRGLAVASTVDDPALLELRGRIHLVRGRAREARAAYQAAWTDHEAAAALAREAGDRRLEMAALRELGGDVLVGLGRLDRGVRAVPGGGRPHRPLARRPGQRGRPARPARRRRQQPAAVRPRRPVRAHRGGRRPGGPRRRRPGRGARRAEDRLRVQR